ncbi:MAG: hypothetical protein A2Z29_09325 [Chloroflexi bacterium RBG_16_56_11]|nr:MAG: hypothetical protein A2Z29_09325 [Chloroflexi bacterium RBG_16_56_11]
MAVNIRSPPHHRHGEGIAQEVADDYPRRLVQPGHREVDIIHHVGQGAINHGLVEGGDEDAQADNHHDENRG